MILLHSAILRAVLQHRKTALYSATSYAKLMKRANRRHINVSYVLSRSIT